MTRPKTFVLTHRLALVATFLSLVAFTPAHAEDFTFSIAPQDLAAALKLFAVQSHREIFFAPEVARGKKSKGIKGTVDDLKALKAILEGTGLNFSVTASNAILVNDSSSKSNASQAGASTTSGSAPQNTGNPTRLAQSSAADSQSPASSNGPQNTQDVSASSSKTEDSKGLAEILVKGSRILNVDVTRTEDDPQPYYIFDSQTIEQSGAVNLEDFLKQQLTMNTTYGTNSQQPSLAGNTSGINLRGLGINETLILIDGRRSAGVTIGVLNGGQPDINGIPTSAVERIEVLPSSASAIYGGAAVGGVINIVLKRNYSGADIKADYENVTQGHAPLRGLSATDGFTLNDGKTRVMISGHYSDSETVDLGDRLSLVQRGMSAILAYDPKYFYGPFNPFPGATTNIASADYSNYPTPVNLTFKNGTSLNSPITFIPAGTAPGSNLIPGLLANAGKYNLSPAPGTGPYGLQAPLGSAPTTKSLMATINQELTPMLDVFTELSTNSNSSRMERNGLTQFLPYLVPAAAPDNPFTSDVIVNVPLTTASPLTTDSVTQSGTFGLLGHLPGSWNSELDYTWSRNSFEASVPTGDYTAFTSALANGTINPFVDTLAYPLNLSNYSGATTYAVDTTLNDLALRASGPLWSFPWGHPTLTVGVEHRKEGFHDINSFTTFPLTPADNSAYVASGQSQSTDSVYMEALIPLVTAKNALPFLRSLDVQLAGRSEKYTVNVRTPYIPAAPDGSIPPGTTVSQSTSRFASTNPTIALRYKPVEDLTFRVSYARAFLPPQPGQLLPNPTISTGNIIIDPLNQQIYPVNATFGGNPKLKPQTSRDWDLGAIWEPRETILEGVRVDLEYYKITQPDYITSATVQQIVNDPGFAGRVTRDPTTGLITLVDASPLNAAQYKTEGWDLTLGYHKSTNFGIFDLHAVGTLIKSDQRQYSFDGPTYEFAGYPDDGGEAKIKVSATLAWSLRHWGIGWTTTYYGNYGPLNSPGSPSAIQYGVSTLDGGVRVPSQTYHDIFGSYVFDSSPASGAAHYVLSNLRIQLGVKNLFNSSPPLDTTSGGYFYSYYGDPRLRSVWASIRKSF